MGSSRPAVLIAVALVAAAIAMPGSRSALAQKKGKPPAALPVLIETLPAGATVYVGDQESGPAGVTPAELSLPAGEHVVILELDGHIPRFETVIVEPRSGKAARTTQTFAFELDPATATLVVELEEGSEAPEGTRVLVDGDDQGEPPVRVEVDAGAHQVQILVRGKAPYEEWIEVQGGQEHLMSIPGARLSGAPAITADAPTRKAAKPGKRAAGPMGTLRSGVEIGFRRFRYDNPVTANARPYTAEGSLHVVVDAELHPWRRFVANKVLDRLSVIAGAGYSPVITATASGGMQVDAFWRSQHGGLRVRALDRRVAIDIDAEWMHTLYAFRDGNGALVPDTPDVDYHVARIGARVLGKVSPPLDVWLGADNRVVLSGGPLEDRFRRAEVDGVAVRAGAAAYFLGRRLEGRVEGSYAHFGWTFQPEDGDAYVADGGSDAMYGVTITVGGRY